MSFSLPYAQPMAGTMVGCRAHFRLHVDAGPESAYASVHISSDVSHEPDPTSIDAESAHTVAQVH